MVVQFQCATPTTPSAQNLVLLTNKISLQFWADALTLCVGLFFFSVTGVMQNHPFSKLSGCRKVLSTPLFEHLQNRLIGQRISPAFDNRKKLTVRSEVLQSLDDFLFDFRARCRFFRACQRPLTPDPFIHVLN
jgi:hypothetical protein